MAKIEVLERISDTVWEIPISYKKGMQVPARIYGTEKLIREMDDAVYDQITNVATLPGITKYALCMPDGHFGYGFPIGGVAAMDVENGGVISPGGIGFDINCGMRLVVTNLTYDDVKPYIKQLVDRLYERVPAGVGSKGFVKLSPMEFRKVMEKGARWCVENDYGWEEDLEMTEENGCIKGADASTISEKAIERGFNQIGTLGSGNHYLEIQVAKPENIFDRSLAEKMGITIPNQVVVMFHCGSRGFGHQVATDYLQVFLKVMESKYGIKILDRELACAPFYSPEGQAYFAAMKCGLNMSFANRQVILHRIREVFSEIFGRSPEDMNMRMVYDVAHNTAKLESHIIDGKERSLLVHRKGATRAFAPGMSGIPEKYKSIGQPVIIGGSMETGSYLLAGVPGGAETFFSTAHGSGRTMSRTKARKTWRGEKLQKDLENKGIYVRATSWSGLAEEAGSAYKNIDDVIAAAELAGISKRVVRFTPIGNIKG
ncbi:MAG: RtcB family protein [Oscillatoriaceae bacterium SKW80]|nr:RtcB family protein [Oscillatoriaceae bacterium SKYG93]MCX8119407.1 RtcB family protein [Oscillatoriaceae bacterium SKW80]MDW8454874.1 RtcB family protein [Oscillatoriaceae cyanobacterium SKYGB_i_bin93]HIK28347.1 RtcB family protein [Oscillatoriaceae cyanobacterium M7585_C2015_266]